MFKTAIDRLTQKRSVFFAYFMTWKFLFKLVLVHVTAKAQENEVSSLRDAMIVKRKMKNQLKL